MREILVNGPLFWPHIFHIDAKLLYQYLYEQIVSNGIGCIFRTTPNGWENPKQQRIPPIYNN